MANNERLGASFGIDVTDLKAGLSQANRLIRESESEFKAAAAGMDNWADSEDGLNAKIKSLNSITEIQRKKVDALQEEYERLIADGLDPASKQAVELRTKINNETAALNKNEAELKRQTKALEELGEATDDVNDATDDATDGFTIGKGAIASFVGNGLSSIVSTATSAVSSLMALSEETRELRTNFAKLEASFESANLDAKAATKTYDGLFRVFGDSDKATEAGQQIAKIAKNEKELTEYTKILTGVFAEYGESIPIEGLAEGISATSAMSSVQGVLADALEWQGVNLDEYNEKLGKLKTAEERSAKIKEDLNKLYGESADIYNANNTELLAANEATNDLQKAEAELGKALEPVNTAFTEMKTLLLGEVKNGVEWAIDKYKELTTETDVLTEKQRETVTAAQEAAEAYDKTKEAADELAGTYYANVDYVTNNLLPTLQSLVDENGKVKKGEEERAQFILGELNDALGTEYKRLSDIVGANGEIKSSIYDVIEAKKAQIMLEAYEENYRQAVENVTAAEKARATQAQELVKRQERVAEADKKAGEEWDLYQNALKQGNYAVTVAAQNRYLKFAKIAEDEKKELDKKTQEYADSEAALFQYYADISNYETASTLVMKGETEKAVGYLNDLGSGFETAASTAKLSADEQKKVLEQQVIDTEVNAKLMKSAYEQGVEGVTEEMVKTAEEQAEKAKSEFYTVGGNITKGIAEGAEGEEKTKWTLSGAMSGLISKAVAAAKKAAGIKSPARAFKKPVGGMISLGVAEGITDETPSVVKAIKNQVNEMRDAYDLSGVAGAVNTGVAVNRNNAAASETQNGGVTVYQTNNYKQAYESPIEKYKSKQQLFAAARMIKAGAY